MESMDFSVTARQGKVHHRSPTQAPLPQFRVWGCTPLAINPSSQLTCTVSMG